MKKKDLTLFFLCILFLSSGNSLCSQDWELGLKAGLLSSMASVPRAVPGMTFKPITEFSIGSSLSLYFIKQRLGLQPEIYYSTKGFDARERDWGQEISTKYKISYIELSLLLFYRFSRKGRITPGFVFGPYLGIAQKVMEVQTAFGRTEKRELGDNLKKLDLGLVFGTDVRYRLDPISLILGVRLSMGLVNISKDIRQVSWDFSEGDAIRNRSLTVFLGVAINLAGKK